MPIPFVRPATVVFLAVFVAALAATTIYHIRDDLLHPLVLINGIFAYFVVIPAITKFVVGEPRPEVNISRYPHPDEMLFLAVGALLAAYLVICVGFYVVGRIAGGTTNDVADGRTQQSRTDDSFAARISPRALFWFGITGFAVGAAFFVFYVIVNGGFVRMFTVQPRSAFQTVPNTGRWRWLGLAGLFGGLITALAGAHPSLSLSRGGSAWHLSHGEWLALAVTAAGAGVATLALRGRIFIAIFGAFVLIYVRSTGRVTDRTLAVAGAVVVALGATFSAVEAVFLGGSAYQLFVRGVLQVARLDVFMGLLYHVPTNTPYQWGSTLVGAIPIQWPGQPPVYGQQLDLVFGDDRPHILLSAMLPGELYLNAGPIGLFVGATIYGATLRAVYRLRAARGWLARGLYPIALVTVVFYWPTNIAFATKTFVVRMLLPVCVALVAAVAWERLKHHFDLQRAAATDD